MRKEKSILLAILLLLLHGLAVAGIAPPSARAELLARALEGFWGRAKMPDGKVIEPESDQERRTLPVNEKVANYAFEVGELSGLAEWCNLDWKPVFTALTRGARRNDQSEKQVAFISVVHGVAQGAVASAMAKSGPCNPEYRDTVRRRVEAFLARQPE